MHVNWIENCITRQTVDFGDGDLQGGSAQKALDFRLPAGYSILEDKFLYRPNPPAIDLFSGESWRHHFTSSEWSKRA